MHTRITPLTIGRYLVGDREAIRAILDSPSAVWLGLLFVLSAAFAREYDAESLLHEPWHVLLPLAASLSTSIVLYGLLYAGAAANGAPGRRFIELYPSFLALYWMTAPLAWLYAIPVERFLTLLDAARVNFALLGIVSLWRVLLITRAAAVMFSSTIRLACAIVMWFADTVMVAVAIAAPKPIFSIMGGVHLSESESLVISVTHTAIFLGIVSWPFWLIGMLTVYAQAPHNLQLPARPDTPREVDRSAWMLAAGSLVIWAAVLPLTQPEQLLRERVERELKYGDVRRGLAMMSAHEPGDFPPHWSPPPRWGYGESRPDLDLVLKVISEEHVGEWVADAYWKSAAEQFEDYRSQWQSGKRLDAFITFLERHPDRTGEIKSHRDELMQTASTLLVDGDADDKARGERIKKLLESVPSP